MPQAEANGLSIEYETFGDRANPALLLIMGVGCQLIMWPEDLCQGLADRGFFVIRYDNRDIGLTTKMDDAGAPDIMAALTAQLSGEPVKAPYSLDDMADDAAALLKTLGIDRAHIVGASMGGMIAQLVAIRHPEITKSLTSIMSTTGNPDLPAAKDEAMGALLTPPADTSRESLIAQGVTMWKVIGSPKYPATEEELTTLAARNVDRSICPEGFGRQVLAILSAPARNEALAKLSVPAMVLHGADDPLVPVEGGKDTADAIPGARLEIIDGMAHDFTQALVPVYLDKIGGFVSQVESGRAAAE
ncbi:alpha/beta fold hydrolase [Pyruvatibacter mobilis]|uniref:Alpha/beta fold hydrolase n=1 Tax=Pyruvatibacter mobilis TaxID=1712261 RepID=A0A845Q7Z2_9HYPH|nr:alpha/beta hydrolase [Pyruvatibacter mobilis]NBG94547.1 alpha/beta fold hydrolase [Pyruvatibacter mobilis]QJD74064.1 alpha/beta hydrolase [Pyruvatibacter mobilis]GGD03841.1 alpha/beta hydrolase [Pyruvatibacter mobilis]